MIWMENSENTVVAHVPIYAHRFGKIVGGVGSSWAIGLCMFQAHVKPRKDQFLEVPVVWNGIHEEFIRRFYCCFQY